MTDRQAFVAKLYDENAEFLMRLCRKRTGYNPYYMATIDDCIQETFLTAFVEYDHLIQHENRQGWLVITCMHRLLASLKRARKEVTLSLDTNKLSSLPACDTIEEYQLQKTIRCFLSSLLSQLTAEEKAVFVAYFCDQHTMRVIASSQMITENHVKSAIRRIRRKAKNLFKKITNE